MPLREAMQRLFASDDKNRKVRARRRRGITTESGERERAEAPKRDRGDGGSKPPSRPPSRPPSGSSGSSPPGSGGSISPKMLLILAGIVVLLLICGGPSMLSGLFSGFDGTYTYADGEQRVAQLQFVDGELRQIFGFANEDGSGAPREIVPQVGDTFTLVERWMDLDGSGNVTDRV